jgi:hypothetical protein
MITGEGTLIGGLMKSAALFLVVNLFLCSMLFSDEILNQTEEPSKTKNRIFSTERLDRISLEVINSEYRTEIPSLRQKDTNADERHESWRKRHPVLTGTIIGFGVGFSIGIASGSGSDYSAGTKGIVVGLMGAGVGALIASIAS